MSHTPEATYFIFATGIENSYPTIHHGQLRVDEMAKCHHYDHWRRDFELAKSIGVTHLRYGPPIFSTWKGEGEYDWSFADETFAELRRIGLQPIVDLCHFGVPDWVGNFQNPDFPKLFAGYAAAFAQRFPWVQLYTPVNEMYICALFSGKYGWWNEQLTSDRGFVTALKHLAGANVLAMKSILGVRPDAIFIQSESTEYFHAKSPRAIASAEIMNDVRFLSLDLNYGKRVSSDMYEYLLDNGMTRGEYHSFLGNGLRRHCIMGNDYYSTNEHLVDRDGSSSPSGEIFGYYVITMQYYARYRVPVMHTETNCRQGPTGQEAVSWLRKQWANVMRVRNDGVPIVGFTWYSLTDQVDWNSSLREPAGHVDPLGLFDLARNIRPVGRAYQHLIGEWAAVLPTQSVVLALPIEPAQATIARAEAAEAGAPQALPPAGAPRPEIIPPDKSRAQAAAEDSEAEKAEGEKAEPETEVAT
jgi:beta-glucosidase